MKVGAHAFIFLYLLGSLGETVGAITVAPTRAEVEAMYSAAAQELEAGNYAASLEKLDALDARQPDLAAAKNLRGVALMRMGEYGRAEKALQKARELDPDFWEARFNLAEAPFLAKNWTEARDRFLALAKEPDEEARGATAELIQFKILLTYLEQDKARAAQAIADRLKGSSVSPAYYYAQAAMAFHIQDETGARVNLRAAEKAFSAQLNRLFVQSFYEIGWLEKPAGATPVTLEVTSPGDRIATAQAAFGKAKRAFREGDFERATELLDEVEAAMPNQAVTYNLRGEILLAQGKEAEAESAFRNALVADPQSIEARQNLARIPFRKHDYETARKQLEELLGAISGEKPQRQREQLIRYQIYLALLREGRESAAQKALEEFKMMDQTPALYYAQAAWAFQHGNPKQAGNWVANATNLFSAEQNRAFASSLADLGWLAEGAAGLRASGSPALTNASPAPAATAAVTTASSTPKKIALTTPTPRPKTIALTTPSPRPKTIALTTPSPSPKVIALTTPASVLEPETSAAPVAAASVTPSPTPAPAWNPVPAPVIAKNESTTSTPPPAPEASVAPKHQASRAEEKSAEEEEQPSAPRKKKRTARARSKKVEEKSRRKAGPVEVRRAIAVSPIPAAGSDQPATAPPEPHENLGDKVRELVLQTFRPREVNNAAGSGQSAPPPPPSPSPTATLAREPRN
jgi:Flp pilus assembly protein TadD